MIETTNCFNRGCKNYTGIKNNGLEKSERAVCKAYPDEIPERIAYGDDKHLIKADDQKNNIIFEKK